MQRRWSQVPSAPCRDGIQLWLSVVVKAALVSVLSVLLCEDPSRTITCLATTYLATATVADSSRVRFVRFEGIHHAEGTGK